MHHTHNKNQVKYLMPNLFPKVKKYGRPMGSLGRCHRKQWRRIQARHSRDKRTIRQIDKFVWRPYQDRGSASSRPITLAKSTGPSTFHPDNETINHVKLIVLTSGNQRPQLCLLSWQHLDLPISLAAQRANIADKRLTRISPDGTPSPSLTSSYSQSW